MIYIHMSNGSFIVANKWFLKISSTVWRSEGFRHGEQRFPSTGQPVIWRLRQHITEVFSDPMSVINVYLPSGLALGFFRPPSCINSKAKATLWTWGSRKQHSRIDMLTRFRVWQRCIHLLFEALGGEEEVVQRDKIILKQPHQQHQVDTVGKLRKQTDKALTQSHCLKIQMKLNPASPPLTCVSSSVTSRFSLFRCLLTKVMRDWKHN